MHSNSEGKKKQQKKNIKKNPSQALALNYKINYHQVYIVSEPFGMLKNILKINRSII